MRRLFLKTVYDPIPTIDGRKKLNCYPFLIPYGRFYRMEAYTFLTTCQFVTPTSHKDVRDRLRTGLEYLMRDYLENYGKISARYSRDVLKPKLRGIKPWREVPWLEADMPEIDLGSTALLLAVLCSKQVRISLWDCEEMPEDFRKVPEFLLEDLIDLFDRYLIEPSLYRYTHAIGLAHLLLVPFSDQTSVQIFKKSDSDGFCGSQKMLKENSIRRGSEGMHSSED